MRSKHLVAAHSSLEIKNRRLRNGRTATAQLLKLPRFILRSRVEAKGWKLGSAKELLGLSDQEGMYIELRHKLAESLKARGPRDTELWHFIHIVFPPELNEGTSRVRSNR